MAQISSKTARGSTSGGCNPSIWFLLVTNILMFIALYRNSFGTENTFIGSSLLDQSDFFKSTSIVSSQHDAASNPLGIPQGTTPNLPSIRVDETAVKREVHNVIYGGKGDKAHLGGFTEIDLFGISPAVWKAMVNIIGVKTLMDVGCGRGISTSWFVTHGVKATCVEGSHDAVMQTMLPDPSTQLVEHDFSRGPWWPAETQDAVWCVEFLEHVGRNFHHNYLPIFRKSALIFATHSIWGGWHHVEVHPQNWWITKMEMYGFQYAGNLTQQVKDIAKAEQYQYLPSMVEGKTYNAQHVYSTMMVFINPAVASLKKHAHLLAEPGCFKLRNKGIIYNRKCGEGADAKGESIMPQEFEPIMLTPEMDTAWETLVKKNIGNANK
jgi:hypothetical protein